MRIVAETTGRRLAGLIVLIMFSIALAASPTARADTAAVTLTPMASAVQLVQLCSSPDAVSRSLCVQVLSSVSDAARAVADLHQDLRFHCAPADLSPNEISDLLLQWTLENQALADRHYGVVILAMLRDAYPCAAPQAAD